jgi:biopolymer transport protein ExbB
LEHGQLQTAVQVLEETDDFVARTLRHGLDHHHGSLPSTLQVAAGRELERMGRGLPILDTIVTLVPLLGLLGTIFGIMHSFRMMGEVELTEPKAVTGGIA